jgi:hypothetical protein
MGITWGLCGDFIGISSKRCEVGCRAGEMQGGMPYRRAELALDSCLDILV